MKASPIRILIAKPGLDGHDRGAKVVALALRDAGFEVIYTGLHQSMDDICATALEEDVAVIGLSVLSGAHLSIAKELRAKLQREGLNEMIVLLGGNIPARDIPALEAHGVDAVFPTGSRFDAIADFVRQRVAQKNAS